MLAAIDGLAVFATHVFPDAPQVRDPKDQIILNSALAGGARYLVSGDADLLALAGNASLGELLVVTPAEFLAILDASNS